MKKALTIGVATIAALAVAGCGSGSATALTGSESSGPAPAAGGDNSIREYGAEAGAKASAPTAAMRSFFTAIATGNHGAVCAGLAASNRELLGQTGPVKRGAADGCARTLGRLLNPAAGAEARRAAKAPITTVRIMGDTAFVLFTPEEGKPSFAVMKEEAGAWKAICRPTDRARPPPKSSTSPPTPRSSASHPQRQSAACPRASPRSDRLHPRTDRRDQPTLTSGRPREHVPPFPLNPRH
jgi:hypothetical protein